MHPGRSTALVPLRALGVGKSRLALRLTPEQRATLASAMFRDVVAALAASRIDEVVVAAGDQEAARLARGLGLDAQVDPPSTAMSLDQAIAAAASTIDTDTLLVVTADLPYLSPAEVDEVVATDAPVVIAPTEDGGTGALLRRPADVIGTAYGPGSAHRHERLAADAGVAVELVDTPGLREDVDTWTDLVGLRLADVGPHTATVLPELLAAA
jgi:2-phospho-L-lactate/phosphoenolpyruvate guanylyltransferase